jgi:hypothetical protein
MNLFPICGIFEGLDKPYLIKCYPEHKTDALGMAVLHDES